MIKIGILQTDSLMPDLQTQYLDYAAMFRNRFAQQHSLCEFENYDVLQAVPDSLTCDAYIITGSRHSVYDDLPWIHSLVEFLRDALACRKKVIGICFGHQLMAHFFGGRVSAAEVGWSVGVQPTRIVAPQKWMDSDQDQFALLSSHKDQVQELPSDATLFAGNPACPVAGFTMGEQVLTFQGHPEFTKAYANALMTIRRETLGEAVFAKGHASLVLDTDENLVARWICNFILA